MHVRAVLEMISAKGMLADVFRCAFHKASFAEAGFWISAVGGCQEDAFMVVMREYLVPDE